MNINLASKVTGYNIDAYGSNQYKRIQDDQNTQLADIDGVSSKLSNSLSDSNIVTVNDLMEIDEESLVEVSGFSSADIELLKLNIRTTINNILFIFFSFFLIYHILFFFLLISMLLP